MMQNSKPHTPLVKAGFIRPVLDKLDSSGVSIPSLLRKSSLHRFNLSDNENYVPVALMYRLFETIRQREGINDFFEVFADHIKVQGMCEWVDTIASAPDLLSALRIAAKYDSVQITHQRIRVDVDGPTCKYSQIYLDQPQPGRDFTDYADFCLLYNFFKQVGGADWQPLEIHLQSLEAPNFDQLLPAGYQTKIRLGQPATSIVFPTTMLAAPLSSDESGGHSGSFEEPPRSLTGIIEQLLSSACDGQLNNLELVTEMLGMSPRTLRRRLAAENTTFSEIVDNWRFKSSLSLLALDKTRINDIAIQLGYANAPNFERAFKRWTGRTPGAYRDTP